jgi:hypothetical protein
MFKRPLIPVGYGVFEADELAFLQRIYDRIAGEPWMSQNAEVRESLARYVLGMYLRGLWSEKNLYALCLVAAREKFSEEAVNAAALQKVAAR